MEPPTNRDDDGDAKPPQQSSQQQDPPPSATPLQMERQRREVEVAEHKKKNLARIQQKLQQQRASRQVQEQAQAEETEQQQQRQPQQQQQQQQEEDMTEPSQHRPFAIDPTLLLDMETAMTTSFVSAQNNVSPTSTSSDSVAAKLRHLEDIFDDEAECLDGRKDDDENGMHERCSKPKCDRCSRGRKSRLRPRQQNSKDEEDASASPSAAGVFSITKFWCGMLMLLTLFLLVVWLVIVPLDQKRRNQGGSSQNANIPSITGIVVPPAPDDIIQVCLIDRVLNHPDGARACQDRCDVAHCCHHEAYENTCWMDNEETCQQYIVPCSVLLINLVEPSSNSSISIGSELVTSETASGSSATVFPNAMALWSDPTLLPPAPTHLRETCQAASLLRGNDMAAAETSGVAMTCLEACDKAACCWKTPPDAAGSGAANWCGTHPSCADYQLACGVLLAQKEDTDVSTTVTTAANSIPLAPPYLERVCDADYVHTTVEALLSCQQSCLPASCCWRDMGHETSVCSATDPVCDGYREYCSVLNEPFLPPLNSTSTLAALSRTSFSFTTPGQGLSSSSTHASQFMEYPADTILDVCFNHDNAVNRATGKKSLCEQVCEAGSCCFLQLDFIANACPQDYPEGFCDKYYPCKKAFASSGAEQVSDTSTTVATAKNNPVDQACTLPTSPQEPWDITGCVEVCGESTCCFTLDPAKSCINTQPNTDCSYYEACRVLYHPQVAEDQQEETQHNRRQQLRRVL